MPLGRAYLSCTLERDLPHVDPEMTAYLLDQRGPCLRPLIFTTLYDSGRSVDGSEVEDNDSAGYFIICLNNTLSFANSLSPTINYAQLCQEVV